MNSRGSRIDKTRIDRKSDDWRRFTECDTAVYLRELLFIL